MKVAMIDYKFTDRYNDAITQRRIAMPKFECGSAGSFYVEARPVGKLRKIPIMKRLLPYLAGDRPNIEITIKKLPNTLDELEFKADLLIYDPKDTIHERYNPDENTGDVKTPHTWNIQSKVMLRTEGSYIYEVQIMPKEQKIKEGIRGGQIQIAQIPIIILELRVLQLLLLVIVAIIGGLITYFVYHN